MAGPLKGDELRDAKDFLVGAIAGQAQDLGILPAPDVHERAVDPIIRKVEVDAEEDARKGVAVAPAPPPEPEPPRGLKPGMEWLPEEVAGVATIDHVTGEVTLQMLGPPPAPEPPALARRRIRFRQLKALPDWAERVQKVLVNRDLSELQKAEAYEKIYQDSIRVFGRPKRAVGG